LYQRKHGGEVPSESSFKRVLERAGLTERRRVRRSTETGRLGQGRKATQPNEVWSVDFKGWWRDREGLRVEPLTVRDEHSRMLLEMRALENIRTATLRTCFERLFERYGMPGAIRSDNGAHERMHLDIRRELEGRRVGRDQTAFDLWREEYNTERPHEVLGMRVPAEVYQRSERVYEGTPTEIDYGGMDTRRVREMSGVIGYRKERIMITSAIGGWTMG
jgi:transposase InsO family protein